MSNEIEQNNWLALAQAFKEWDECDNENDVEQVIERVRNAYRAALASRESPPVATNVQELHKMDMGDGRVLTSETPIPQPAAQKPTCKTLTCQCPLTGTVHGMCMPERDPKARAEIERLTKERDHFKTAWSKVVDQCDLEYSRAIKAEAERDEARAQVAGAFETAAAVAWDDRESGLTVNTKIRALTPDDAQAALQSMLEDAERDMRDKAAETVEKLSQKPNTTWGEVKSAILALPLKHSNK